MTPEEIRQRRRQKILARSNPEVSAAEPTPSTPKQQQKPSDPSQPLLVPPPVPQQPLPPKQEQGPDSQESKQRSSNIRQHLQTVITRNKNNQLLLHGSKVIGILLGLISTNQDNSQDWITLLVCFMIFSITLRVIGGSSQFQKAKKSEKAESKSQISVLAELLESAMSITRYLRVVGSITLCYLLGALIKIELGMF